MDHRSGHQPMRARTQGPAGPRLRSGVGGYHDRCQWTPRREYRLSYVPRRMGQALPVTTGSKSRRGDAIRGRGLSGEPVPNHHPAVIDRSGPGGPDEPMATRPHLLGLMAFALPALAFLEVTIVGRLLVTEILLLVSLPWLWRKQGPPRVPGWFLLLWCGWLASQVVTDLVVGSAFRDYIRGWAGIAFTLTNFAAILLLANTAARARLFAAGMGVGGLLGLIFDPHPNVATDLWQWGLAFPLGLLVAAGLAGRTGPRRRWANAAIFLAFGGLNLVLGYRSLGGISMLAGLYLAFGALVAPRARTSGGGIRRAVLALTFVAAGGLGLLGLYGVMASNGLLGSEAQARYEAQGGTYGVLLGGRPEGLVSTQAILDSPVLGHGSWASDPYYAELLVQRQRSLGYEVTPEYVGSEFIPAHSYLMGAWVWAGFLGGLFWIGVLVVPVWMLASPYAARLALAPLLVFAALFLVWDILFSPYGLGARISAPFALSACLLGLRLIREAPEAAIQGASHPGVARHIVGSPAGDRADARDATGGSG